MSDSKQNPTLRIGADVGGTFTDIILIDKEGACWPRKVPSTPPDFEKAILAATQQLLRQVDLSGRQVKEVTHGATVATNAVLEHRGARTALITTKGFRDVLELRRIRAPQLYDLFFDKPLPLVERYLRFELAERISADGQVLAAPSQQDLLQLKEQMEVNRVESLAVCLLHSYAYPQHEQLVGEFFRQEMPSLPVSVSHEVLRERREYERSATTVVNAYVRPVMQSYLDALRTGLGTIGIDAPLLIMQSAGGLTPESDAASRPVFALESGPAAGVLAARCIAQRAGIDDAITFDMGGTTAKASMIENGQVAYSSEYEVGATMSAGNRLVGGGGELIRAPTIDIAEVGAGGGSIAYLDRAGGLRVGPRSAGAEPGPVCYGRGGQEPTLTDANVVLGYIRPGNLADGQIFIDHDAARQAVHDRIAAPLNLDLMKAAEGIHRIANARTMRALREVSTARGRDPRQFVLIAFGGAGPIHAADLARELHTSRVIVPPLPGLFSAMGLLFGGIEHHASRSCQLAGKTLTVAALQALRSEMTQAMSDQFKAEGFDVGAVHFTFGADLRYAGQTSEIRVAIEDEPMKQATLGTMFTAFESEHERLYGHRGEPDQAIELVTARLIGHIQTHYDVDVIRAPTQPPDGSPSSRKVYFGAKGQIETPVLSRHDLRRPTAGPLLIDEYDCTIVVPPGIRVHMDEYENVVMDVSSTQDVEG